MAGLDDLDKLAAEKVMGWKQSGNCWDPQDDYSGCNGYSVPDKTDLCYDCETWQPTRNIAQAWECLEKCLDKWPVIEFQPLQSDPTKAWSCSMSYFDYEVFAPTAPEAIVRACLKAKGVEV